MASPPAGRFSVSAASLLLESHAWTVEAVEVTGPDSSRFRRDVVRHRGAVAVVPLHDDDTVTVVRQYRAALDFDLVEIPAGIRDVDDEPTDTTAARELAEEAGLRAGRLELLTVFHAAPGMSDERVWVYLATGLTEVEATPHGHEELHMTVERIPLAELVALVESGAVTDAKTVIGALLTARRRS